MSEASDRYSDSWSLDIPYEWRAVKLTQSNMHLNVVSTCVYSSGSYLLLMWLRCRCPVYTYIMQLILDEHWDKLLFVFVLSNLSTAQCTMP